MALLIPSPTQGEAFRLWVLDALSRDDDGEVLDPLPFEDEAVYWGDRDHPRLGRFCMLQGLALSGPPVFVEYATEGTGDDRVTIETRRRDREWAVMLTIASKPDRSADQADQLAAVASEYLGRVVGAFDGVAWAGCRAVGLAPLRIGDMQDTARLRGSSEWETRCSVVLTVGAGWYARREVDPVLVAEGTGEVPPVGPLGFDSAQEA